MLRHQSISLQKFQNLEAMLKLFLVERLQMALNVERDELNQMNYEIESFQHLLRLQPTLIRLPPPDIEQSQ
jgi:hypothetical protein